MTLLLPSQMARLPQIILLVLLAAATLLFDLTESQTDKSDFTYTLDEGYPIGEKLFGNIAGVDVDKEGNVIIFHRGSHRWGPSTFDANDVYVNKDTNPIPEETVVTIDPTQKKVIRAWGSKMFYMPHGLSLDLEGNNLWLTDVAMHQVFKFSVDGSSKLIELGKAFIPGADEEHFCKPTSVADTGEFVFVADGYCNSRVVMFSAEGKYLGEFGQSSDAYLSSVNSVQPQFNIPHKITYAKEAKMLCVADRENGRIQCFSFEPRYREDQNSIDETGVKQTVILNGAIKQKFIIADPLFHGRLFSLDYSPIRGGIIVAVSGEDLTNAKRTPLGFVYNVTTGQLISRFAPPPGRTFGMAHDLAITGSEANSLYVVDISPVNLWRFSRPTPTHQDTAGGRVIGGHVASSGISGALSVMDTRHRRISAIWYIIIFTIVGSILFVVSRSRKSVRYSGPNSFSALYSNGYPASINSLFGRNGDRFQRRTNGNGSSDALFSTMFSRRAFFGIFHRNSTQNEFNRIPLEESDNSDDDKSDSDVEEFNINQANPNVKITV
uniref:peptidylamidoglycolate lyase n=1 Tax=Aceria tosichella TaxID=561515 RepID=A0A6G1SD08_9ACAR